MRNITTTVYTFDELSEQAKQNAIEELSNINVDYEWWEFTYEDAKNVGIIINGFDIDRGGYAQIEIDSSCYETAIKIVTDHGKDCDTYKTAETFINDWDALVTKYSDGIKTNIVTEENQYDFNKEADDLDYQFKKDIAADYATILRKEYEYLTSEQAIIETIQCNEYEFTEEGKLI